MSKYYYNKYNVGYTAWSAETSATIINGYTSRASNSISAFLTCSWNGTQYVGASWNNWSEGYNCDNALTICHSINFIAKGWDGGGNCNWDKVTLTRTRSEIAGTLITSNIIAEDGTYPANGKHTDGFWYIREGLVFPALKIRVNGALKSSIDGWVRVNGVLKHIDSIWIRVNGVLKKL